MVLSGRPRFTIAKVSKCRILCVAHKSHFTFPKRRTINKQLQ